MEFTIKNCRIEISFLFFAALTFSLLCDRTGIAGISILAAIIHESGHIAAMILLKIPPQKICMNPFGIDIVEETLKLRSRKKDAIISLAGPAFNFFSCFIFAISFYLWPQEKIFSLAAANLGLGLFNILPVEPLDGGQALYSLLCLRFPEEIALRTTQILSFFTLLPLATVGFLTLFRSGYNFTILLSAGYLAALLLLKRNRCI